MEDKPNRINAASEILESSREKKKQTHNQKRQH